MSERKDKTLYSRKNSGYFVSSPPPNYNGVAFDRSFKPSSAGIVPRIAPEEENSKSEEKKQDGIMQRSAEDNIPEENRFSDNNLPFEENRFSDNNRPFEENVPAETRSEEQVVEETRSEEQIVEETHPDGNGREGDILSAISEKEFRLEDMLLIGAVLLFVSGELDGDIMLLLGLLLVAGI